MFTVGEVGPGGGLVFHDSGRDTGRPLQWGRYLEMAPPGWHGATTDPLVEWSNYKAVLLGAGGFALGTGPVNTRIIVDGTSSGAAHAASNYRGGGLTDWFLPCKAELNLLFESCAGDSAVLEGGFLEGGFMEGGYWSSTEYDKDAAWAQGFDDVCQQDINYKFSEFYVRPIRVF